MRTTLTLLAAVAILALAPHRPAGALEPAEVAVVYHADHADSRKLAEHYAARRKVPATNLLAVDGPAGERIGRDDYNQHLADALRKQLSDRKLADSVRALLLVTPIPIEVAPSQPSQAVRTYLGNARAQDAKWRQHLAQVEWGFKQLAAGKSLDNVPDKLTPLKAGTAREQVHKASGSARDAVAKMPPGPDRDRAVRDLYRIWQLAFGKAGVISLADGREAPAPPDNVDLNALRKELSLERAEQLKLRTAKEETAEQKLRELELEQSIDGLAAASTQVYREGRGAARTGERAAVDSELSCLWWDDYRLNGPQSNPLNWRRRGADSKRTLMVFRLDAADTRRLTELIDASVDVEADGLAGKAYFDLWARKGGAYSVYDRDLTKLADLTRATAKLDTTLERTTKVLPARSAPQCAIYCGWYSLRQYVPAFTFNRGAVAWHIASFEAQRMRQEKTTTWVPNLIRNGVVATFGAVQEPYLHAFPKPSEFFGLLLTGRYTMAEVYYLTVPHTSWMMTFVGDPLYRPYAKNPPLKLADLDWFTEPDWVKKQD